MLYDAIAEFVSKVHKAICEGFIYRCFNFIVQCSKSDTHSVELYFEFWILSQASSVQFGPLLRGQSMTGAELPVSHSMVGETRDTLCVPCC